jgi:hypothetical protein
MSDSDAWKGVVFNAGVEARGLSTEGLFATRDFAQGELLFAECGMKGPVEELYWRILVDVDLLRELRPQALTYAQYEQLVLPCPSTDPFARMLWLLDKKVHTNGAQVDDCRVVAPITSKLNVCTSGANVRLAVDVKGDVPLFYAVASVNVKAGTELRFSPKQKETSAGKRLYAEAVKKGLVDGDKLRRRVDALAGDAEKASVFAGCFDDKGASLTGTQANALSAYFRQVYV